MSCKNLCERLAPAGSKVRNPYQQGLKYCRRCEVYLKSTGSHCRCCGLHLRSHPVVKSRKAAIRSAAYYKRQSTVGQPLLIGRVQ